MFDDIVLIRPCYWYLLGPLLLIPSRAWLWFTACPSISRGCFKASALILAQLGTARSDCLRSHVPYIYTHISVCKWGSGVGASWKTGPADERFKVFWDYFRGPGVNWCIQQVMSTVWHPKHRSRMFGNNYGTLERNILMNLRHLHIYM